MVFTPGAAKQLQRLGRPDRERIRRAIDRLPDDGDLRPLKGKADEWRLRVGDWRVRFRRNDAERVIAVVVVAPRGSAYQP